MTKELPPPQVFQSKHSPARRTIFPRVLHGESNRRSVHVGSPAQVSFPPKDIAPKEGNASHNGITHPIQAVKPTKKADRGASLGLIAIPEVTDSPKALLLGSPHKATKETTRSQPQPRRSIVPAVPTATATLEISEAKFPVSILQRGRFASDPPPNANSLLPQTGSESCGELRRSHPSSSSSGMRRSKSEPSSRQLSFDPRVWVREFTRSESEQDITWYNQEDLERFKRHAMALIVARQEEEQAEYIPTGTGRVIKRKVAPRVKAIYAHAALRLDGEDDASKALTTENYMRVVSDREISWILIVDPHDIVLHLFSKAFKSIFPKVSVATAQSSSDAMRHIASANRFDIILVEERLDGGGDSKCDTNPKSVSGSALLRTLRASPVGADALLIGVSAHLAQDVEKFQAGGADVLWQKPPPTMDRALRNILLLKLLVKRGRSAIAEELFGSLPSG